MHNTTEKYKQNESSNRLQTEVRNVYRRQVPTAAASHVHIVRTICEHYVLANMCLKCILSWRKIYYYYDIREMELHKRGLCEG